MEHIGEQRTSTSGLSSNDLTEDNSDGLRNDDFWTDEDSIRLISIVNKVGKYWAMISKMYKNYLKNKDALFLANAYGRLKRKNWQNGKIFWRNQN